MCLRCHRLISGSLIQRLIHLLSVYRWSIFRLWEGQGGFVVRRQLPEEREWLVCIAAVSLWQRADVCRDCLVACLFLLCSSSSWSWNITVSLNIHPVSLTLNSSKDKLLMYLPFRFHFLLWCSDSRTVRPSCIMWFVLCAALYMYKVALARICQ